MKYHSVSPKNRNTDLCVRSHLPKQFPTFLVVIYNRCHLNRTWRTPISVFVQVYLLMLHWVRTKILENRWYHHHSHRTSGKHAPQTERIGNGRNRTTAINRQRKRASEWNDKTKQRDTKIGISGIANNWVNDWLEKFHCALTLLASPYGKKLP